jgi:hypothetical protein
MPRPNPDFGIVFKVVFAIVCLLTAASFLIGLIYANLSGVAVFDLNYHAMHDTLSPGQAAGIARTVQNITGWSVWPLLLSNLAWITLFLVYYVRYTRLTKRLA